MNLMTRHIITALLVSFFTSLAVAAIVFYSFPLADWKWLWERHLMGLPFIIFLPALTMTAGLVYGVSAGTYWKRQLRMLEDDLYLLEQGRPFSKRDYTIQEWKDMSERIFRIHRQVSEQVKLSQKLASEKAAGQEQKIQEIISQERNRLARDLHDSVSQQLFAASMLMSALTESKKADHREIKQLKRVEEVIHQTQLEMRALLLHLRPFALKGKSLKEGIEELLEELSQKVMMDISWKLETIPLDKGLEDHLFRILQESISNTLRHAKADSLEVLLIARDGMVIMRMIDDGIGFQVEGSKAGSYGLQNMYERAVELGGTMKVISVPDQGTRLEVKIPLLYQEGEKDD
ncbi:sensor histidine kinase [Bacillus massiliglaciei]|uniref:sensor histidine kinase n=1 Tax=Bacillus massiliglaciei TaxID=1816693 RepID=UPI000DA60455|nr:sensor histidine kinase [Bacillus massiliglaciei]